MQTFTQLKQLCKDLSGNQSPQADSVFGRLMNIEHRYVLQEFYRNEASFTDVTVAQQQAYNLPPDYSKLKDMTVTTGNLKWTPTEVLSRREWDQLNVFPYFSTIPNHYYIYGNKLNIWPIPSAAGMTITYNYKRRIPDLSIEDYTTGTVTATNNSATVTGAGTTWTLTSGVDMRAFMIPLSNGGDGMWYYVNNISTGTNMTLSNPYQGTTVTGAAYILGQVPLVGEDFQDIIAWKSLSEYYTSIVPDEARRNEYMSLYKQKYTMLDDYEGSKSNSVNLGRRPINRNPNLYWQGSIS